MSLKWKDLFILDLGIVLQIIGFDILIKSNIVGMKLKYFLLRSLQKYVQKNSAFYIFFLRRPYLSSLFSSFFLSFELQ